MLTASGRADSFWEPDGQAQPDMMVRRNGRDHAKKGESTSSSLGRRRETSSLTVLRFRAMNVWTEVNSNATGNQIPAPPDTGHNWLSLRRLGGQLVGRLDPEPAVLSGDGRARSTLRKANKLSPWRRWIARGFSLPESRSCPAITVSFESSAHNTTGWTVHSSSATNRIAHGLIKRTQF